MLTRGDFLNLYLGGRAAARGVEQPTPRPAAYARRRSGQCLVHIQNTAYYGVHGSTTDNGLVLTKRALKSNNILTLQNHKILPVEFHCRRLCGAYLFSGAAGYLISN